MLSHGEIFPLGWEVYVRILQSFLYELVGDCDIYKDISKQFVQEL